MRGWRSLGLACLGCVVFWIGEAKAEPAPAEDMAIAREIVELSGAADTVRSMLQTMQPMMRQQIQAQGVGEAQTTSFLGYFMQEFEAEIPSVIELTAIAYAEAFNQEQLQDMRDFWGSPTGQELRRKQPELTSSLAQAGARIGRDAGARALQRMLADEPDQQHGS